MRPLLRAAFAMLAWVAGAAVAAEAPRTLRVDYFHTGGQGVEAYALDRVSTEPLPWPGHPARTIDSGEPGVYRYEVRDGDGRLLYARGFASIFGEWITTAETATSHRTFHESLRFPVPGGPVEVTVLRRGADQSFREVWRVRIDPADPFIVRIGDGYTAAECNAKFGPDARRMADALFRHEPLASRRTPVSAFQGANYDSQAFYRSQLDWVMFTRNEVPFCRVCQRALGQVIDLYAGPRRPD